MTGWPALLIGAGVAGGVSALAALAIAALAGGAVSPLAGGALGLAFGLMIGRIASARHAVVLGTVAALVAVLTIFVVQRL